MATSTPWGASEYTQKLCTGAAFHGTAGHGGLHVTEKLAGECLSVFTRNRGINDGSGYWYEEDCDICLPLWELFLNGHEKEVCAFIRKDRDATRASLLKGLEWFKDYLAMPHPAKYHPMPNCERLAAGTKIRLSGEEYTVQMNRYGIKGCMVFNPAAGCQQFVSPRLFARLVEKVTDAAGKTIWEEQVA